MTRIDEIAARAAAATLGPWKVIPSNFNVLMLLDSDGHALFRAPGGIANADLIVHARDDIPFLLAEVKRLEKHAEALRLDYVDLLKRAEQAERERDAAVEDVPHNCGYCANAKADGGCKCLPDGDAYSPDYTEGFDRDDCEHWQYRGPQEAGKENDNAEVH